MMKGKDYERAIERLGLNQAQAAPFSAFPRASRAASLPASIRRRAPLKSSCA
jgi:hypothetical protein